ncbi:uncharacterized protein LOC115209622 [Argonauta hians]
MYNLFDQNCTRDAVNSTASLNQERQRQSSDANMTYRELLNVFDKSPSSKCHQCSSNILFSLVLFTGISQIGLSIGLLCLCRNQISEVSCAFSLKADPCAGLAVPVYIGCLIICIAIFGFACLGRRASAALLLCITIGDICLGFTQLASENIIFTDYFKAFNSKEICQSVRQNSSQLLQCWNHISHLYPACSEYEHGIINNCIDSYDIYFNQSNLSENNRTTVPCISDINRLVSSTYTDFRFICGPIVLLNAFVCVILTLFLEFFHQQKLNNKKQEQNMEALEGIFDVSEEKQ